MQQEVELRFAGLKRARISALRNDAATGLCRSIPRSREQGRCGEQRDIEEPSLQAFPLSSSNGRELDVLSAQKAASHLSCVT